MDPRTPSDLEMTGTLPLQGEGVPVAAEPAATQEGMPSWVAEARDNLPAPGKYIAFDDSGRHAVVAVQREWTRIGRSLAADVRFDDATVSRRHALIVHQAGGVRVLDDRSLNGVSVNGRRVEWSPVGAGDEIVVGRHTIYFLDAAAVETTAPATAAVAE